MRIRNRKVRLPISSLCPVPIWTDPISNSTRCPSSSLQPHFPLTDHASHRPTGPTAAEETEKVLTTENGGGGHSMKEDELDGRKESVGMGDDNGIKKRGNGGSASASARGGALLEGSRCSRVNGRGWRCCQPTLVGYALCEHHLGKGRLKSLTHVRKAPKSHVAEAKGSGGGSGRSEGKKRKLGVAKARSLSSLLGIAMDQK